MNNIKASAVSFSYCIVHQKMFPVENGLASQISSVIILINQNVTYRIRKYNTGGDEIFVEKKKIKPFVAFFLDQKYNSKYNFVKVKILLSFFQDIKLDFLVTIMIFFHTSLEKKNIGIFSSSMELQSKEKTKKYIVLN